MKNEDARRALCVLASEVASHLGKSQYFCVCPWGTPAYKTADVPDEVVEFVQDAVNAALSNTNQRAGLSTPNQAAEIVVQCLAPRNTADRITGIKLVREFAKCGLREAYDAYNATVARKERSAAVRTQVTKATEELLKLLPPEHHSGIRDVVCKATLNL